MSCQEEQDMTAQVIELIDVQLYRGQQVLNRYHYVDTTGVASVSTLVSDFITDVLPLIAVLQTPDLSHVQINSRKVFPTANLVVETPISPAVAGGNTGSTTMASYAAASAKWTIGATVVLAGGFTGHIKKGGMRLAGMRDGDWSADASSNPGYLTAFAAMTVELFDPGTDAFLLCVASYLNGARVRQQTVQSYALVSGASAPSLSTQNTRKVLRGRTF
jgi:hypothetical protein